MQEVVADVLELDVPVILEAGDIAVMLVLHLATDLLLHALHLVHIHRPVDLFLILVLPQLLGRAQEGVLPDLLLLVFATYCHIFSSVSKDAQLSFSFDAKFAASVYPASQNKVTLSSLMLLIPQIVSKAGASLLILEN